MLERPDRLAESLALPDVDERLVEDLARVGQVGDRCTDPLLGQVGHHVAESAVEGADQVGAWDQDIFEEEFSGVGLRLAYLVQLAPRG